MAEVMQLPQPSKMGKLVKLPPRRVKNKAAVCRTFGIPRRTLNDTLTRAGWSGHRA